MSFIQRHGFGGFATCWLCVILMVHTTVSQAQSEIRDIVYAQVDGKELRLDLYLPAGKTDAPLIVWVHGGAWQFGNKEKVPTVFRDHGFAIASIDFRASTTAKFPANVHDIKAAIRFLRANASRYGYSIKRVAIAGDSSGGHLAALVGVTNGHAQLEGDEGEYTQSPSDVDAIISYYGASNLKTILSQSTPHGLNVRTPALKYLLGALPDEIPDIAALASPVTHVDRNDPPLLLIHGDQDRQMPINQSHELFGAYKSVGGDVQFHVVYGAGHGGKAFYSGECLDVALSFLRHTIANNDQ